jgi:hypothetical protein
MNLEPEQGIEPDCWVIIEVKTPAGQFQKILSGWSGSYLYGDSWRMSNPCGLGIRVSSSTTRGSSWGNRMGPLGAK